MPSLFASVFRKPLPVSDGASHPAGPEQEPDGHCHHHHCTSHPPPPPSQRPKASLLSLPPEIHLLITRQLIYPDALSLKHTSRYFYSFVDTGVRLKVEWLMSRRMLHLDCPNSSRCDLGSDLRFCRGSVALLMKRRREHIECESRPGLGCLVFGTSTCTQKRKLTQRARSWLRSRLTVELWWVLLALIPLVLSWLWMAELLGWGASMSS